VIPEPRRDDRPEKTSDEIHPSGKALDDTPRTGPMGDVQPRENDPDPRANPGQPPEKVEDRPMVSQVKPEDYPKSERAKGA
jgi:hypothetical protein